MSLPPARRIVVEPGCKVEVEFRYEGGDCETQLLSLVPDEQADFTQALLGVGTPLAKALIGYSEGERVFYRQADILEVRILRIVPGGAKQTDGVATRRQENLDRACRQVELANLISFAASFNGKWGDYDPSTLTEEWEKNTKNQQESTSEDGQ